MTPTTPSPTLAPSGDAEYRVLLTVARFVLALPECEHLPFALRLLQAMECGRFDWVAHGDCVIEAIGERVKDGEW